MRGILLFNIWLILAEHFWKISGDVSLNAIYFRAGSILIILLWLFLASPKIFKTKLVLHPLFYILYGLYLLLMHSILSSKQIYLAEEQEENVDNVHHEVHKIDDYSNVSYLFYIGRWSLSDAMVYVLFCFNATLRFGESASISGLYILIFTLLPFLLNYSSSVPYHVLISPSIIILFTFYLLCVISSQDIEMKLRNRFLKLSELGHALRRRDTLINSILPKEIALALRKGETRKLSAFHPNVSVLFCSIVDFGRHSSISHAEVYPSHPPRV